MSLATLVRRLRTLLRRAHLERDMDDEIRLHLEMETADRMSAGADPDVARRDALLAFGGVERWKDEARDARGFRPVDELRADVRHALRGLRRNPAFALTAILTLALGIGAAAAVFSAVRAVLLAPLPYPEPERLVRIFQQNSPTNRFTLSNADWQAIRAEQQSFESVALYRPGGAGLALADRTEWIGLGWATADFFRTLGVSFVAGGGFQPGDDVPGAPRKLVVSEAFWNRWFGDREPIGASITLDGTSYTVAGVIAGSRPRLADIRADVWPILQLQPPERRGPFGFRAVGRLRDDATLESATRDLAAISERLFPVWAASFQDATARLTPHPLHEVVIGDAGRPLAVLGAGVALVLLIAIVNVANLVLVRALGRAREMAVRTALGASRWRLVRQLATESIVLGTLGGVAGIALAALGLRVMRVLGPQLPRIDQASLDARLIAFVLAVSIASGVLVGLHPVWSIARNRLGATMRSGDRRTGATRGTRVVQGALVAAEFALALPLLLGAGLLLHSFVNLQRVDPGFDPRPIFTATLSLPPSAYPEPAAQRRFWEEAVERVRAIPGITHVGLTTSLPPDNQGDVNNFDLVDRPVVAGGAQPVAPWAQATPELFEALGVPLLAGRMFRSDDTLAPVLLVSRTWAERYYPGEDPVGRRLLSGGCTSCEPSTVIGVVGDVKYLGLRADADAVYEPAAAQPGSFMHLVVRTELPPASVMGAVREAIRTLDPRVPVRDMTTMEARLSDQVANPRRLASIIGAFAAVAMMLAAMGVFGVLSYIVAEQRREIGVRIALGADERAVVGMVMRRGLGRAVIGLAVGLAIALQAPRVLGAMLFGISATNPVAIAGTVTILMLVAVAACWVPGRRAARIQPTEAIAAE